MSATALRTAAPRVTPLDVERLRADFPILRNVKVEGKSLVFLDNAASSQMPQQVIDRIVRYRTWEHANIHRGVHYLSETATAAYEHARSIARGFLNAGEDREVIFTSNCCERDGSNDSMAATVMTRNAVENAASARRPTPAARPTARQQSITPASLGSSIFER